MTTTTIYTREQAKASDIKLNELRETKSIAARKLGWALDSVRHTVGDRQTGWGRDRRWGLKPQEAFDKAVALAATDETYKGREAAEAIDKYKLALSTYEDAAEAVRLQNMEWRDHGRWSRFLAVVGGHIHDNEGCHTVRDTTLTYWLPELSGDTEANAVEVYGEVLCSHCYPSAPANWQNNKLLTGPDGKPMTKAEQAAAQAAKDAEKAAKLAAKNAKALFVPGTSDLVQGPDLRELKTEIAATRVLIEAMADRKPTSVHYDGRRKSGWVEQADGTSEYVEVIDPKYPTYGAWIEYAIEALAAKHGKTTAEVRAEMNKKVQARRARQARGY